MTLPLLPYTKPHASTADRVAHLRSKGLQIRRPAIAAKKIDLIGYMRLRIYFLSRRQLGSPGRPFQPGVSYQDILRLYDFDMRLRAICFDAVGQFEILFRNAISEALSHAHGSHPYFEQTSFQNSASQLEALQTFVGVYQRSKDERAKHYREHYSEPALPPIWILKEFLTFGASVRLFNCLSGDLKRSIAGHFGVSVEPVFASWIQSLVDLRNICAHHDRLFNRHFQKQPATFRIARIPAAPKNQLRAILECLDYLMMHGGIRLDVTTKVGTLIRQYSEVRPGEVGY
jgi:abortive infection bacteriophage resistance protein